MKLITVLACLAITVSLVFVQDSSGWRGIVPLRSTRADVERVLRAWNTTCQCYSTETETVHVTYAIGPCKGDLPGWNVPADTVLSLQIYPKNPILFSEMKVAKEEFVKTVDDATFSHYGNGQKGLRYSVSWDGTLQSIWYGPSVKNNHLRCAGFPLTDGGITAYRPYYEFHYESVEHIKSHLGEFGIRLIKEPQFKGFVIIYAAPTAKSDTTAKFVTLAKDYLIEELDVDPKALEVINGGSREASTVELFLIPRDWPPPIPTPTLGGVVSR